MALTKAQTELLDATVEFVQHDWKEFSEAALAQWKRAVKAFGIQVYRDPRCQGSDQFGFILSNRKLSPQAIRYLTREEN